MAVNTARVAPTRTPRTGFAYLDAVLDQPGSVIAMAHRGGAMHAELVGLENTLDAFRHAVTLGYHYLETDVHATRDGVLLAFHDAVLDRVTDQLGPLATLTAEEIGRARIGGAHAVPTMAELLEEFPAVRFNIDLKAEAAVHPLAALIERTAAHGPGVRRVVLAPADAHVPRASRPAGSPPPRRRRRWPWSRRRPRRPRPHAAARSAPAGRAAGAPQARAAHGRHAHPRTTCARRRSPRARVDRRRARRDAPPARPRGRRTDHRSHRPAAGRPRGPGTVEGPPMTHAAPTSIADLGPLDRLQAAEGVELVRLGQLGVLHDGAHGAVRAVHDHGRRQRRGLRRRRRHLQQDGEPARARTWPPGRCRST